MSRIERAKKVLRLSGLMLLGAAVGWVVLGELLLVYFYVSHDWEWCRNLNPIWCLLTGVTLGVGIGLAIEWLIRVRER